MLSRPERGKGGAAGATSDQSAASATAGRWERGCSVCVLTQKRNALEFSFFPPKLFLSMLNLGYFLKN